MIYYKDYDFKKSIGSIITNKKVIVYNDIFSFDIETSSIFQKDKEVIAYDYAFNSEYYNDFEKKGYMYIWQFGIEKDVIFGRTWEEFIEFIELLHKNYPFKKIIYVHNLSFECQFLRNVFEDMEIFARKKRKPIKISVDRFNLEFRCSYMLTNLSLDKCCKNFDLPIKKLSGKFEYNILRNSKTKLTELEMEYCKNDILSMYYLIDIYRKKYGSINAIPLTQTGEVRKEITKIYSKDLNYINKMRSLVPRNYEEYKLINRCFTGGYTHANSLHTNYIMKNVNSKDLTSAYPYCCVAKKFPMSNWTYIDIDNLYDLYDLFENEEVSYILDIEFRNIESKFFNTYISKSKCIHSINVKLDNGRVYKADYINMIINNIDLDIISKTYNFNKDDVIIKKCCFAYNKYLDKRLIELILEYYYNKTQYKGIEEYADLYMKSKQYINSIYGMFVTNFVAPNVSYKKSEWTIDTLTDDNIDKLLLKQKSSFKTNLSYSWGIFVTSYTRQILWNMIIQLDKNVIYSDTDSVKYTGDYEKEFDFANENIIEDLRKMCRHYNIDFKKTKPIDKYGIVHQLGIFDTEKPYERFITMGAKKYAYEQSGETHITVSGVSKKAKLEKLEDFRIGKSFNEKESGRSIFYYNDEQTKTLLTDYQGNTVTYKEKFGSCLQPTTYTLSMTDDYLMHIDYINNLAYEVLDE